MCPGGLQDLNADVQLVQSQGQLQQQHQQPRQAGGGDAGPAGGGISAEEVLTAARRRCALAALSVAHLAAVPELRQQLDRGAGEGVPWWRRGGEAASLDDGHEGHGARVGPELQAPMYAMEEGTIASR